MRKGTSTFGAGFTLIELLIVIAITAILAGILLPTLAKSRERARRVVCMNDLKEISLGLSMYGNDYAEWLPQYNPNQGTQNYDDLTNLGEKVYMGILYPKIIADPEIFYCPSEKDVDRGYEAAWAPEGDSDGTYDYWGKQGNRNRLTKGPGRAIVGDINISWGDGSLDWYERIDYTHRGEGQNVLHLGGDVQWYKRVDTKNSDPDYEGVPNVSGNFDCVDE